LKLLLDTQVLLWLLAGDERRFGARAVAELERSRALVSAATVWEIAIKRTLGKVDAPAGLVETLMSAGVELLAITPRHAEAVGELPPVHRDPFDRMLVAQARLEDVSLLTADARIAQYPIATLHPAA
jgi:PIN domain nuclease of toxin-antitoxin system